MRCASRAILLATTASLTLAATPASAGMIVAKYQDKYTIDGKDVTDLVRSNVDCAIFMWQSVFPTDKIPLTLNVKVEDLGGGEDDPSARTIFKSVDAKSGFLSEVDLLFTSNVKNTQWFLDPTPQDDSEFKMTTSAANTNPATEAKMNSGRFGEATAEAAKEKSDFFTVALHEIGHGLGIGFSQDEVPYKRYANEVTEDMDIDLDAEFSALFAGNKLPILEIPIFASHFSDDIDENFKNVLMGSGNTGVRLPGFRVLPSDVDILGIASVYDLKKEDVKLDPQHCPEPASLVLAVLGALGLAGYRWQRRQHAGSRNEVNP